MRETREKNMSSGEIVRAKTRDNNDLALVVI